MIKLALACEAALKSLQHSRKMLSPEPRMGTASRRCASNQQVADQYEKTLTCCHDIYFYQKTKYPKREQRK